MNKIVYFIPGLGADERLFSQLNITGIEERYLNWIEPDDCITIADYAARYIPMIDTSEPFYIIGMSMGGMIAVELQKHISPEKMILVSTVKTRNELPPQLRTVAKMRLNALLSGSVIQNLSGLIDVVVRWQTKTQRELFMDMLHNCSPQFLEFAINACINWSNETMPHNYIHLHGNRDPLFPGRRAKHAEIIEGGNHFMIYEMGEELTRRIQHHLDT